MTKNNKNKNKKKRVIVQTTRIRRSRKNTRKRSRDMAQSGAAMLAHSICNPGGVGACIPDGSKNVGCFTCKGISTISTQTAGTTIFFAVNLNPGSLSFGASSAGGTYAVTGSWASSTAYTALASAYDRYRPVSASIKVTFVGAWNSNGGTVTAGQLPATTAPNVFNGGTISSFPSYCPIFETWSCSQTSVDPMLITWRPEDSEDFQFETFATAAAIGSAQLTPTLCVGCDGLAVAGAGTVMFEYVVQFEGYYGLSGAVFGAMQPRVPADPGWYEKAMNMVNFIPQIGNLATTALKIGGAVSKLRGQVQGSGLQLAYPSFDRQAPLQIGWR
jgi:hypothetical protein